MGTIVLIGEQAEGKLKKATLRAVGAAQLLAQKNGGQINAVVIGKSVGPAAQELAGYGVTVHAVEGPAFEHALAETHGAAAVAAARSVGATDVVVAATAYGKDIAPRVAAQLGAGLASDVLAVGGANPVQRALWGGHALRPR